METREVAQGDEGHLGGARQTESMGVTKERGAREETGGIWSRRSQAGTRPQPQRGPTVELTEGGAMEEELPSIPGGRPMATGQVVKEPEVETKSQ